MDAIIRMIEFLEMAAREISPPAPEVAAALAVAVAKARAYEERRRADSSSRALRRLS